MKTFLKRILNTNWKTSLCAVLVLVALVGRWMGKLDREDMSYLIGVAVSAGLFLSKDGVRTDTVVAREDVPTPNNQEPS